MLTALYNATRSSTGSGNMSLMVKGVLLGLVPVIITVAKAFNLNLAETALIELIEAIFTAVAAFMIVAGLVRKMVKKGES